MEAISFKSGGHGLTGVLLVKVRFVQAIDGFRQGVVVAVSFATNRGLYFNLSETLSVTHRDVLTTTIAMVDQTVRVAWLPGVECLPQDAPSTKSVFMLLLSRSKSRAAHSLEIKSFFDIKTKGAYSSAIPYYFLLVHRTLYIERTPGVFAAVPVRPMIFIT